MGWENREFREKFWHSSSHLLASAVRELFPETKFGIGPAIEEGFYYDLDSEKPFTPEDLEKIEKKMLELAEKNEKFVKKEISKKDALALFRGQPYKVELINELEEGKISTYSNGKFTDLCRGPHIESTGLIKAVKLLKTSGAYWKGSEKNKMLQRIYGISFPEQKMLDEWLKLVEEAEKRSHIKLGKELDLFSFQKEAPGTAFYHNNATQIWIALTDYLRSEQRRLGYIEVITPLIMKDSLWKQSGHWDHYKENMYFVKIDNETYAVKPMNCPGHILIYKNSRKSYRDLPVKMSEFGIVHRHEKSGVLNGLFRVRKFTQDDAHLFCTPEQIKPLIKETIRLIDKIYRTCGFAGYHMELSTMPENAMGSREQWDQAEQALKEALEETNSEYKLNPGDGAFYGPKIDFHIKDSLGRTWQCGTIQLDFQMPQKFGTEYIGSDDKAHTPVMVHRALYGSLDRFLGILTEHFGGAFPLWLAPVQAKILAIAERHKAYAEKLASEMAEKNLRVAIDAENSTVSGKVRQAQLEKIPLILVVGDKEEKEGTVTVRTRDGKVLPAKKFSEFLAETLKQIEEKK
ncbi:MAG: threonine--tRNA ligase [Candidatus ainarchaeum sp.]|nr:threonine--tRNA ligase [Candidatus ainarchaeum sp.]